MATTPNNTHAPDTKALYENKIFDHKGIFNVKKEDGVIEEREGTLAVFEHEKHFAFVFAAGPNDEHIKYDFNEKFEIHPSQGNTIEWDRPELHHLYIAKFGDECIAKTFRKLLERIKGSLSGEKKSDKSDKADTDLEALKKVAQ